MAASEYTPFDRQVWEEELEDFVPAVVYDMHVHLWSDAHRGTLTGPPEGLRLEIDMAAMKRWSSDLYPGRQVHHLALATPLPGMDVAAHNGWLAAQVRPAYPSAASLAVTPAMAADELAAALDRGGFAGLKPYRTFAPDRTNARIHEYLPDHLLEVADDRGVAVTLHLARPEGPADPDNLADLSRLTRRFPRVQWILAHCARAFNARHLERSIQVLRDLPNLWYDTAAVCDLYAHCLLWQHEERRRVMFGSDAVVAGCDHGKYITYGHAWQFYAGAGELEHCDPSPTLVVYEQLRQQRRAARLLGLSRQEIEDHFAGNAQRLLALVRGQQRGSRPQQAEERPS